MAKDKHLLTDLWHSFPEAASQNDSVSHTGSIAKHLADMFSLGPYYFYTFNVVESNLSNIHADILRIHGLESYPSTLHEIIALVHPDDIGYVMAAEKATLEKIQELGFENQLDIKCSYCFRMEVAGGKYHLFHHQSFHLSKDDEGRTSNVLNIHTDINHLVRVNNRIASVSGIGNRTDNYLIDLNKIDSPSAKFNLSKREMEVLPYLAKGMSTKEIAAKLFISAHTVSVHRKKLLSKTGSTNTTSLISLCIEQGLI